MPRKLDPHLLAELAAGQWGMFTAAQARRQGASAQQIAHLADAGALERVRHGVYRITGTPDSPADPTRAAWLALDPERTAGQRLAEGKPGGVISHLSAAEILRLGDLPADAIEIVVDRRRQSRNSDVRYRQRFLRPEDWEVVDGLPTTTAIVTIDALAADQLDGSHLARIVRDAILANLVSPGNVAHLLRRYAHLYGARLGDGEQLLDQLIDDVGLPSSLLEVAARTTAEPVKTNMDAILKILTLSLAAKRADSSETEQQRALRALLLGAGAGLPDLDVARAVIRGDRPSELVRTIASRRDGELLD